VLSLLFFMIRKIGINFWSVLRYITLTLCNMLIFTNLFVNLTKYQKGVYCLGVKVFNMLPSYIKVV